MPRRCNLSKRIVSDIEFASMIFDQMACKFDVILYHTETTEVLFKEGCLNK